MTAAVSRILWGTPTVLRDLLDHDTDIDDEDEVDGGIPAEAAHS